MSERSLRGSSSADDATDVDEIIGDHAEADPTLHSELALVAGAAEPVSTLDHADASFASGAPFRPLRNQRFFCSRLRSGLLLDRLGTHTRLMPIAFAAASFPPE